MKTFTLKTLIIISVLIIILCNPVHAVIIDEHAQMAPNSPAANIAPEQVNDAAKDIPSNALIIDPDAHTIDPPALESDNNTQAIQTIINEEQNTNSGNSPKHNASSTTQNKPNHLKGLSITMALLGMVFGCFAFTLRKGQRTDKN